MGCKIYSTVSFPAQKVTHKKQVGVNFNIKKIEVGENNRAILSLQSVIHLPSVRSLSSAAVTYIWVHNKFILFRLDGKLLIVLGYLGTPAQIEPLPPVWRVTGCEGYE